MYPIDEKKYWLQARFTKKVHFWSKIKIFIHAHLKNADFRQITLFMIWNRYYLHTVSYDLLSLYIKIGFNNIGIARTQI